MKLLYSALLVMVCMIATTADAGLPPERQSGEAASALPADVKPDSLSRLPNVQREKMDELGKKLYDELMSGQAGSLAGLQGPYGVWLHSPRAAEHEIPLFYYLRFQTNLGRRLTELGILVAAREFDSQFEWSAHEPTALKEGLEPAIIDVVRNRKNADSLGEKEATIIAFGRELFGKRKVSTPTFARARKVFGEQGVTDLAVLMGNYAAVNALINAFDIQLQPNQKPLLPTNQ